MTKGYVFTVTGDVADAVACSVSRQSVTVSSTRLTDLRSVEPAWVVQTKTVKLKETRQSRDRVVFLGIY